jgi:hypothetical protein
LIFCSAASILFAVAEKRGVPVPIQTRGNDHG